jgi:hypothetical protein
LLRQYDSGKKCGKIFSRYIIQKYINNPLLIQQKKFSIRAYMLISSTDPLIVYYYGGFLRISTETYDKMSFHVNPVVTDTDLLENSPYCKS